MASDNELVQTAERDAAPWVISMLEHHQRTGCYRVEDLLRLLGDPAQSVDMGPLAIAPTDSVLEAERDSSDFARGRVVRAPVSAPPSAESLRLQRNSCSSRGL
jgi:hypothetical protein